MRRPVSKQRHALYGLVALAIVAVAVFFGFTKTNPFANPYEIKAAFKNVNDLKPRSPVRIAGVNVGKVKKVEAIEGGRGAIVTMAPVPPSIGSTFWTLPTFTPAIRTGERGLRSLTFLNAALIWYGLLNGLSLRNPATTATATIKNATRP